jgi:hypothetical protein
MRIVLPCALLLPCLTLAGAPGADPQPEPESPAIEISFAEDAAMAVDSESISAATEPMPLLRPVGFAVDYRVKYSAFGGEISLELQALQGRNKYRIRATTEARGLAKLVRSGKMREEAHFIFDEGNLQSQDYVLDAGGNSEKDSAELVFDREEQSIASVYEGNPTALPLKQDVYDRISADVVIMMDLRNGRQPRELHIAEKNQLREYTFTFQGEETVEVPAGTYRTVKYLRQRTGSSRSTLIWFAMDANFVPVRMEQLKRGKTNVTSVATGLTIAPQP